MVDVGPQNALSSVASAWTSVSNAPIVADTLAALPTKFLAVASVAAFGYYVDQKLLLSSDIHCSGRQAIAFLQAKRYAQKGLTILDLFEQSVEQWPHKPCLQFERRVLSFQDVDRAANRVAHWGQQQGLEPGATVALLMENRPEFVIVWLGLAKIGVVTALLNTHGPVSGLVHGTKVANTKWMVVGHEMAAQLSHIVAQLPAVTFYIYGDGTLTLQAATKYVAQAQSLDSELGPLSTDRPSTDHRRHVAPSDLVLLIYTRGTTGWPKAARVSHFSLLLRALVLKYAMHVSVQDRLYCPVPLYHAVGTTLAVGTMLVSGATLCLARRFGPTTFWDHVRAYHCTVIQYNGTICRSLLHNSATGTDSQNHVRAAFGTGLRPEHWATFQARFGIPSVYELYGSTGGPLGLLNACTTNAAQGHFGRRGWLTTWISGMVLVKYDVATHEHVRSKHGFFQRCGIEEPGELLVRISPKDVGRTFDGYYQDAVASKQQVLTSVFHRGDRYFRTGDLFQIDARQCWHLIGRTRDPLPCKDAMVPPTHVAERVAAFPGLKDVCIYSVCVPGTTGRACMAAMVVDAPYVLDTTAFARFVTQVVPVAAMPVFLREREAVGVPRSLAHTRARLRQEGMNPYTISDRLWVYNRAQGTYVPLTRQTYHQVITQQSRL